MLDVSYRKEVWKQRSAVESSRDSAFISYSRGDDEHDSGLKGMNACPAPQSFTVNVLTYTISLVDISTSLHKTIPNLTYSESDRDVAQLHENLGE
jgi:hypothetical protein